MKKLTRFSEIRNVDEALDLFAQRISDAKEVHSRFQRQFIDRSCPVCGSKESLALRKFIDLYGVVECTRCRTKYVNPCPDDAALNYYYNECITNKITTKLYHKRTIANNGQYILDNRLNRIDQLIQTSFRDQREIRLLELGCASGSNLRNMKLAFDKLYPDKVFHYHGIDIDSNAISTNCDDSIVLKCIDCEKFVREADEKYHIIMHFELIEHLIDPLKFMISLKNICNSNSYIIFTTPNSLGLEMLLDYNDIRLLAHSIFPPMHLNAYSIENIGILAIVSGYKLYEVSTPGRLDVDIINESVKESSSSLLKDIATLDEKSQLILQNTCRTLKISSHMQCIFTI